MGKQEIIIYSKISPKNKKQSVTAFYRSMETYGVSYQYYPVRMITEDVIYDMLSKSNNGFEDIVSSKFIKNYEDLSISEAVQKLANNRNHFKQMIVLANNTLYSKNVYDSRFAIFPKNIRTVIKNHYMLKGSLV